MDEKIIIISPYRELKEIADEAIKALGMNIQTSVGELREGVRIAQAAQKDGKEIIISRGGTAKVIRENVALPVIEIKVSGYDLLRAIYRQKDNPANLGVAGYINVTSGAKAIVDILGLNVSYINIDNEEEVNDKIRKAAASGINFIIGDTISVKIAEQIGLGYDLIKSGREAVIDAIFEARELYEAIVNERSRKEQLKTILDFSSEGIIAVDNEGRITLINPAAEKIFGITSDEVKDKKIDKVIPNTRLAAVLKTRCKELGSIQKTEHATIATNRIPIIIDNHVLGAVATFQDVTKIMELEQKIRQEIFSKGLTARHTFHDIIGNSDAIKKAVDLAGKYGSTDSTVLIFGESGTGKELFAQSMHNISKRRSNSFVAINCAALPGDLLESELFGYEEGAFTGARKGGKKGLFELAHNGTIFLDEVGEMDPRVQSRILRVIQEKEVMRIGADKVIPVNVRVIAATNRILRQDVELGRFRQDLFYRLDVLSIEVPPLRKRKEDIGQLFDFFADIYYSKHKISNRAVDKRILASLKKHDWPGNVRELQNVTEKLVVISDGSAISEELLATIGFPPSSRQQERLWSEMTEGTLDEIIDKIIEKTLKEENYNKTRAAIRLGIDRATLQRRLNRR